MAESIIRDIKLAPKGHDKINWVREHMPVLRLLDEEMSKTKPLAGKKMVVTIHLEAKTAYMAMVLKNAGADVTVTGSNPLSTQDDVCAALVENGVRVFAWYNTTPEEYNNFLHRALDVHPDIIIDDGGDLIYLLHGERSEAAVNVIGGAEETTTGLKRDRALAKQGKLKFPMIAVNDADCKHLFDNRYGTGQSTWESIMNNTNLSIAGKTVVVAGYGWCGKGVAARAKGLGANVIVTEVDPVKALEIAFDGFRVMPMMEAAAIGDIFVTVTGCSGVISLEHMKQMKNGAILSNAGHFDVEVDVAGMRSVAKEVRVVRNNVEEFTMPCGKKIYLLAEGRLVNLAAGDGHPAEIMDMSFAVQVMSTRYLLENNKNLKNEVYLFPEELDKKIAELKLRSMGMAIDKLTEEQLSYLSSYEA